MVTGVQKAHEAKVAYKEDIVRTASFIGNNPWFAFLSIAIALG